MVFDEWPDTASFQAFFDAHSEQIKGSSVRRRPTARRARLSSCETAA